MEHMMKEPMMQKGAAMKKMHVKTEPPMGKKVAKPKKKGR